MKELKVYRVKVYAWFQDKDFLNLTEQVSSVLYIQGRNFDDARKNAENRKPEIAKIKRRNMLYNMYACYFEDFELVQVPDHEITLTPLEQKASSE